MRFLFLYLFCSLVSLAQAKQYVKVIDGDSIVVDGVEMRLEGIDAPEYHQLCYRADKSSYPCGIEAFKYMKKLVQNQNLSCKNLGKDRYKRQITVCFADGLDINQEMVKSGWAVAYDRYSRDYVDDEKLAKKKKKGVWQGKFMKPELWRRLQN